MSEFCKQCAAIMFPPDVGQNDFAGLCTPEDTAAGLSAAVLCEGCGPTCVDHTGRCIGGCWERH